MSVLEKIMNAILNELPMDLLYVAVGLLAGVWVKTLM